MRSPLQLHLDARPLRLVRRRGGRGWQLAASPGQQRSGKVKTERKYGRIYFGEGDGRWSVTDPEAPDHRYTTRDHASHWLYMICTCPDTKTALEKVRLIRRALRTVERQPTENEQVET